VEIPPVELEAQRKFRLTGLSRIFHAPDEFSCKALRGAAVVFLLQVPDNAANGRIRQRLKGENISA